MKETKIILNEKPGKAAAEKGNARLPEDFERLRQGENFILWHEGDTIKIETTLSSEDLFPFLRRMLR